MCVDIKTVIETGDYPFPVFVFLTRSVGIAVLNWCIYKNLSCFNKHVENTNFSQRKIFPNDGID